MTETDTLRRAIRVALAYLTAAPPNVAEARIALEAALKMPREGAAKGQGIQAATVPDAWREGVDDTMAAVAAVRQGMGARFEADVADIMTRYFPAPPAPPAAACAFCDGHGCPECGDLGTLPAETAGAGAGSAA